jgi:hypothetical protein
LESQLPRISDNYTDIAVYIYRSLEEANNGVRQGGSGFLVGVPLVQNPDLGFTYVVTNRHVVANATNPVVRLNRLDGGIQCIPTKFSQWAFHPNGDDIAVLPLEIDYSSVKFTHVPIDHFVSETLVISEDIGIGDDVVMVGRFINHEGAQRNTPAVRFGNIAMMPTETIITPQGLRQQSFLVEVRSLPGYSGSAVLIYSPCAMFDMSTRRGGKTQKEYEDELEKERQEKGWAMSSPPLERMHPKGPYLLGIDFCHIHRQSIVNNVAGDEIGYVKENTGMAGVIPAWKIVEVLKSDELETIRTDEDFKITRKRAHLTSASSTSK